MLGHPLPERGDRGLGLGFPAEHPAVGPHLLVDVVEARHLGGAGAQRRLLEQRDVHRGEGVAGQVVDLAEDQVRLLADHHLLRDL